MNDYWDEINRVLEIAKEGTYDFIIGTGGGKTIDTARVVARKLGVKYISAPTIAATDAPTASECVVYSNEGSVVDYFITSNPDYVLMDTRIIAEAPARFLVSGMGDALATWFEAETCDRSQFRNIGWFGPRGLATVVFGIIVADSNLLNRDTIVMTAVCGVTLSIIFHGISANPLIALLVKKGKKQV